MLGGLTTFVTMAYIIVVNPQILAQAGMPADGVVFATCISAAAATLVMGLYANYPIALAPGMSLNAYFTYAVCLNMDDVKSALPLFKTPIVVKADGLAAGKGVVIAQTREEAAQTAEEMLTGKVLAEIGRAHV